MRVCCSASSKTPPRLSGRKRKPARVTLSPNCEAPTPERLRHAEAAGAIVVLDHYRTETGEKTQLKRQRLVSPLERLWKAGVIDAGQYGAARRYQRDADLAQVVGPGAAVRYEPRMVDGGSARFLLPIEAASDFLARLARAREACGTESKRTLAWIAEERLGWREQAREWWPAISEASRERQFKRTLRMTCTSLSVHYRLPR
jgi:hypothetical protein